MLVKIVTLIFFISTNALGMELITFNYPPLLQSDNKGFVDKLIIDFQKHSNIVLTVNKLPVKRAFDSYISEKENFHLGADDNFTSEIISDSHIIPLFDLSTYLLFLKKNNSILKESLLNLKNIRVGILRGSLQEEIFAKKFNFSITKYTDTDNAINLLKKGRVDFITFSSIFDSRKDIIGEKHLKEFNYHKDLLYTSRAAFFIRKNNGLNDFSKEFNSKVKLYLQSTSYKKLLTETFGVNIPKGIVKYTRR